MKNTSKSELKLYYWDFMNGNSKNTRISSISQSTRWFKYSFISERLALLVGETNPAELGSIWMKSRGVRASVGMQSITSLFGLGLAMAWEPWCRGLAQSSSLLPHSRKLWIFVVHVLPGVITDEGLFFNFSSEQIYWCPNNQPARTYNTTGL